jgi:fumarate hydratase class I
LAKAVGVDLNRPMDDILAKLRSLPVGAMVELSGPLVVARDIAHARLAKMLRETGDLPDYLKRHPVYYAGPAKTPKGMASGSFGPTTAQRMDGYLADFLKAGASLVSLGKGNRTAKAVTEACHHYGGFYLGSIGGPAAILAKESIKKVEVLEYPELGMEAVWKIEVVNFPAFILVDDKGNDFFTDPSGAVTVPITGIRVRSAE